MRSIFTYTAILALVVAASAKPAVKAAAAAAPKKSPTTKVAVAAAPSTTATPGIGGTAAIEDINHWCMFLPPKPGGDISLNEVDAVPFCTQPMADAPNAQIFPEGFVTAAHFVKTATYVQVTGLLNISKYGLSPNDQGGQYDMKAPVGAFCHGYTSFVNLVEPSTFDFCIRCCNDNNCPVGRSSAGCYRIVPGSFDTMTPPYSPVLDAGSSTSATPNITSASASSVPSSSSSSSALAPFFTTAGSGENIIANNSSAVAVAAASTGTPVVVVDNGAGSLAIPASVAAMAMFVAVAALL